MAYLNLDSSVSGSNYGAAASPVSSRIWFRLATLIKVPRMAITYRGGRGTCVIQRKPLSLVNDRGWRRLESLATFGYWPSGTSVRERGRQQHRCQSTRIWVGLHCVPSTIRSKQMRLGWDKDLTFRLLPATWATQVDPKTQYTITTASTTLSLGRRSMLLICLIG